MDIHSSVGSKDSRIVLIHGVGDTRDGAMKRELQSAQTESGATFDAEIREFVWNDYVGKPSDEPTNLKYVTILSRAWINAAAQGLLQTGNSQAGKTWKSYLSFLTIVSLDAMAIVTVAAIPLVIILIQGCRLFGLPAVPLIVLIRIVSAVMAVSIAAVFVGGLATKRWINETVRCVIFILLWPIVYLFRAWMVPLIGAALLAFTWGIFAGFSKPWSSSYVENGIQTTYEAPIGAFSAVLLIKGLGVAVSALGLIVVLGAILRMTVNPALKILADLARYLGDQSYREQILRHARKHLYSSGANGDLFVVGHSLGSLIALDALRSSDPNDLRWSRIVLITGGSPIRRYIHRFFPAYLDEPTKLYTSLSRICPRFAWVNAFRTFDPIGGRIGLEGSLIVNVESRDFRKFHCNYFSDPRILSAVHRVLAESNEQKECQGQLAALPLNEPSLARWRTTLAYLLLGLPIFAGPILITLCFRALETNTARILSQGVDAQVEICHSLRVHTVGVPDSPRDVTENQFSVRYPGQQATEADVEETDETRLAQAVDQRGMERASGLRCAMMPIRHPINEPDLILVPEFYQKDRDSPLGTALPSVVFLMLWFIFGRFFTNFVRSLTGSEVYYPVVDSQT